MGAERPTAPVAEHTAALVTLKLVRECMGTRENANLVLKIDASHTVDVVNFAARVTANYKLA